MARKEPKTVHIWMPNRRSLCDRRARSRAPLHDEMNDDQFDAFVRDEVESPVCGACIVVASHIRHEAGPLIAQAEAGSRPVFPPKATDAYRSLTDTRWALEFDSTPHEGLKDPGFYRESVVGYYTENWLGNAAKQEAEKYEAQRQGLIDHRRKWRESTEADPDSADS